MFKKINNGGPAFPFEDKKWPGMSLRDYFAASVLPAIYRENYNSDLEMSHTEIAEDAYRIADAMIMESQA